MHRHTHISYFLYPTWLEWQGHFPLAVRVALSFPGQPISPTPELIGNFDCPLSSEETKRFFLLQSTYHSIKSLPTINLPQTHAHIYSLFLSSIISPSSILMPHLHENQTHFLLWAPDCESIKLALAALMGRKFHFMWWHLHPVTQSYPMYTIYSLSFPLPSNMCPLTCEHRRVDPQHLHTGVCPRWVWSEPRMNKASKNAQRNSRKHLPLSLSPPSLRTHFLSELLQLPVQPPGIPAGTFQLCGSLPPLLCCLNTTVSLLLSLQRLRKYFSINITVTKWTRFTYSPEQDHTICTESRGELSVDFCSKWVEKHRSEKRKTFKVLNIVKNPVASTIVIIVQ